MSKQQSRCGCGRGLMTEDRTWCDRCAADIAADAEVDQVRHPTHYTSSPAKCAGCGKSIECIDVTQHMNFSVGSMVKYLWRLGLKGDRVEQLRKVIQYAEFEIARIETEAVK